MPGWPTLVERIKLPMTPVIMHAWDGCAPAILGA
jgi:hypothetical protein